MRKEMSTNQQRGHWWNRVLKGPRRQATSHRSGSLTSDVIVPVVLIFLVAITLVLVAITIGIAMGLVPFK
jgi:hypothetical protein